MKIVTVFGLFALLPGASFGWTLIGPATSGWPTRNLVFYVNYSNCPVDSADLNRWLDNAISTWNRVPSSDLTVSRHLEGVTATAAQVSAGTTTLSPLIICNPAISDLGVPANSVPASTVVTPDGPIGAAIIHLNAEVSAPANIASVDPGKLVAVLAHEMGHVLGLGHSSQPEALMYFSVANKPDAILVQDDMDGITYLYPRNEFIYGPMGCASTRHPHPATNATKGGYLLSMVFLLLLPFSLTVIKFCRPIDSNGRRENLS